MYLSPHGVSSLRFMLRHFSQYRFFLFWKVKINTALSEKFENRLLTVKPYSELCKEVSSIIVNRHTDPCGMATKEMKLVGNCSEIIELNIQSLSLKVVYAI